MLIDIKKASHREAFFMIKDHFVAIEFSFVTA